jgi:hypothetical protein
MIREKQVQFIEGTPATVFRQIYDWIGDADGQSNVAEWQSRIG